MWVWTKRKTKHRFVHGHYSRVGQTGKNNPMYGKHLSPETKARLSILQQKVMTERYKDPKEREKQSVRTKIRYKDPKEREKISKATKLTWKDPKIRTKRTVSLRRAAKKRWKNPEERIRIGNIFRALWKDPEYRIKNSKSMSRSKSMTNNPNVIEARKKKWKDPEYVAKQMKSRGVKPNKLEKHFEKFLNNLYPNEWKFVGDGQLIIGGKCPDFVNVNGKKKLIEFWGDYWHKGQNPQDRIDKFKPFGWDTLVVWEKELKDIDKLKIKLKKFHTKGVVYNENKNP